jgi:hypothetical protein
MLPFIAFLLQEGEIIHGGHRRRDNIEPVLITNENALLVENSWREYLRCKYLGLFIPPFRFDEYDIDYREEEDGYAFMFDNLYGFLDENDFFFSGGLAIDFNELEES